MLTEVGPGLFSAEGALRLPGRISLPVRMTVARLPGGDLVVHSPVAPRHGTDGTFDLTDAVAALGPVRHIVAPNLHHHLFMGPWHERFPEAQLHGPAGMARKRADLPWAGALGAPGSAPPFAGLEVLAIAGAPRMSELVFFHPQSRSLIVSDLLFHVVGPQPVRTRLLLGLTGTYGRLAMSRVWRFLARGATARAALAESLRMMLAWNFVRILPAHGSIFAAADAGATNTAARAALAFGLRGH